MKEHFEVKFPGACCLLFSEHEDGVNVGVGERVAHGLGSEAKPFSLQTVMPPHEVKRLIRFLKRSIGE